MITIETGTDVHIKGACSIEHERLVIDTGKNRFTVSIADVVSALVQQPESMKGKSMHQVGQMLAARDSEIRELKMEVARLRTGALPARHIRDLVLTALLELDKDLVDHPARVPLGKLIKALEAAVDGDVVVPKPPHEGASREYKPLDHGSRK